MLTIFVMYRAKADPTIIRKKAENTNLYLKLKIFALFMFSSKDSLLSLSSNLLISKVKKYSTPQMIMEATAWIRFKSVVFGTRGVRSMIEAR